METLRLSPFSCRGEMPGLLQNPGPVGVELPQEGLARWKPGFDQSYGLPGEEPADRRMEHAVLLTRTHSYGQAGV